jgi:ankyrin repeat protein
VQPLEFGSYENVEILKILIENGIDVNAEDQAGLTALDYANNQDSGVMRENLLSYNAKSGSGATR